MEFVRFVLESPGVVLLPQASNQNFLPEFRTLAEADANKKQFHLFFWNKLLNRNLVPRQVAPEVFAPSYGDDLLVGFHRSSEWQKILLRGSISAEMHVLNRTAMKFVFKGAKFEKWYNKLARWIRSHYARDPKYGICIGPNAFRRLKRDEIDLAQFRTSGGVVF